MQKATGGFCVAPKRTGVKLLHLEPQGGVTPSLKRQTGTANRAEQAVTGTESMGSMNGVERTDHTANVARTCGALPLT